MITYYQQQTLKSLMRSTVNIEKSKFEIMVFENRNYDNLLLTANIEKFYENNSNHRKIENEIMVFENPKIENRDN